MTRQPSSVTTLALAAALLLSCAVVLHAHSGPPFPILENRVAGAYTVSSLQRLSAHLVLPGGDHSDPLATKATAGWKCAFGSMILTGAGTKIWRLETGATNG